jgi:hypothetical protein
LTRPAVPAASPPPGAGRSAGVPRGASLPGSANRQLPGRGHGETGSHRLWGTALHEVEGLDLRRTEPPITDIIARIGQALLDRKVLFAIQVYEEVTADSLAELQAKVDWSMLKAYDLNMTGRNHGIILAAEDGCHDRPVARMRTGSDFMTRGRGSNPSLRGAATAIGREPINGLYADQRTDVRFCV